MKCKYCGRVVADDIEEEENEIATEDFVEEYESCVECMAEGKPFE
jgi:hypothetical protein